MPSYQLEAILTRVGLALVAGVLIATVPVARRLSRYEPSIYKRVFFNVLAAAALVGFAFYIWHLWNRYVPHEPAAPAPIAYPAAPVSPILPVGP